MTSPVSLIVTAFATLADVRGTLTPQLEASQDTTLVLIDLGKGRNRMGGSILAQVLDQVGDEVPDLDDPQDLVNLVNAVNALAGARASILAYHDRSDGGLFAAACEMAFAGHVGVALNVDLLVTEGDGISDSRADFGDAKNWAVAGRRRAATSSRSRRCSTKSSGCCCRCRTEARNEVMQVLREHGLSKYSHFVGTTRPASSGIEVGKGEVQVWRDTKAVFCAKLADLHQVWDSVSWKICQQRDNPAGADAEHAAAGDPADPGLHVRTPAFDPAEDVAAPYLNLARPKVAILREQGVNSHVEMAYTFTEAGFEAYDVHMTDLQSGRARLEDFKGFVACGGFSYGDTLGAGIGWARSITFNAQLAAAVQVLLRPRRTPSRWACATAARCWPSWPTSSPARRPGRASPPTAASAMRRACRRWRCWSRPACSSRAWRAAACRSRWRMARASPTSRSRRPGQGDRGDAFHRQPRQGRPKPIRSIPNGSPGGLTAVTTADGRFTAMMPHAERVFRNVQMSWTGGDKSDVQPLDADLAQCAQVGGLASGCHCGLDPQSMLACDDGCRIGSTLQPCPASASIRSTPCAASPSSG